MLTFKPLTRGLTKLVMIYDWAITDIQFIYYFSLFCVTSTQLLTIRLTVTRGIYMEWLNTGQSHKNACTKDIDNC